MHIINLGYGQDTVEISESFFCQDGIFLEIKDYEDYYEDEEEDSEDNFSFEGMYFIPINSLFDVSIRDIFKLSTISNQEIKLFNYSEKSLFNLISKFVKYDYGPDDFLDSHKVNNRSNQVNLNYKISEIIKYIKKNNGDYILDYSPSDLISNISFNNHANSDQVITLKGSDSVYDHRFDDLVQDKTFFSTFRDSHEKDTLLQVKNALLSMFSSRITSPTGTVSKNESSKSKFVRNKNKIYKSNFHDEENQIDHFIDHQISEDKNDQGHSNESYRLLANLIMNGDNSSFYKAYDIIKRNHYIEPNQSDPIGSYSIPHAKVTVPWALDHSPEDKFVQGEENITVSLRNMFLKKLAETAPITYFLDRNYMDRNQKHFTQAAITSYILRGSQNKLLDSPDKVSRFGKSTFSYIFCQLYIGGQLDTLRSLSGSRNVIGSFEGLVSRQLSFGDIKRIINMVIPYSNFLAQRVRSQKDFSLLNNRFSEIHQIMKNALEKKSGGRSLNYTEDRGFGVSEEDLSNNTEEEKTDILVEHGKYPDKEKLLNEIELNKNYNLLNYCINKNYLEPEEIPGSLIYFINILSLEKNSLVKIINFLSTQDYREDYLIKTINNIFANGINLSSLNKLVFLEKNNLFKGISYMSNISNLFFISYYSKSKTPNINLIPSTLNSIKNNEVDDFDAIKILFRNAQELESKIRNFSINIKYLFKMMSGKKIGKIIEFYKKDPVISKYIEKILDSLEADSNYWSYSHFEKINKMFHSAEITGESEYGSSNKPGKKENITINIGNKYNISEKKFEDSFLDKYKENIVSMCEIEIAMGNQNVRNIKLKDSFFGYDITIYIAFQRALGVYAKEQKDKDFLFVTLVDKGPYFRDRSFEIAKDYPINNQSKLYAANNSLLNDGQIESVLSIDKNYEKDPESIGSFVSEYLFELRNILINKNSSYFDQNYYDYFNKNIKLYSAENLISEIKRRDIFFKNIFKIYTEDTGFYQNAEYLFNKIDEMHSLSKSQAEKSFLISICEKILDISSYHSSRDNPFIVKSTKMMSSASVELLYDIFGENKIFIKGKGLSYFVCKKNKSNYNDKALELERDLLFDDIFDFNNIVKISNFLGKENLSVDSEKISQDVKNISLKYFRNIYRSNIHYRIDGSNIILNKDEFVYIKDSKKELSKPTMPEGITEFINEDIKKYFLNLFEQKKGYGDRFLCSVLSLGIKRNYNRPLSFYSLRELASDSSFSKEIRSSIKNVFLASKKKLGSGKEFEAATKDILMKSLINKDESFEFLFNVLVKKNKEKDIIKLFFELYSFVAYKNNFQTFANVIFKNKNFLKNGLFFNFSLNTRNIRMLITKGISENPSVIYNDMLNMLRYKDINIFCDFPLLEFASKYSDENLDFKDSIDILVSNGFRVSNTSDDGSDPKYIKFKNDIENILKSSKRGLYILSDLKDNYGYKKDEIFSLYSKFISKQKFYEALSDPNLLSQAIPFYQSKSEIFKMLDIESGEISCNSMKITPRVKVIPDKDAYSLKVGIDASCCQHLGGEAKDVTLESLVGANSGVIMFEAKISNGQASFVGHDLSTAENFYMIGQSFVSIYKEYIILDNIEFCTVSPEFKECFKKTLYSSLRSLSEKCNDLGYTLLCGSSGSPFDGSDFEKIQIEDLRKIWSGPISNAYNDFNGSGSIISFKSEKNAKIIYDLKKLSSWLKHNNKAKYSNHIDNIIIKL